MSWRFTTAVRLRRVAWIVAGLVLAAALWVLDIELTYESNVRRGIPADFRLHNPHAVYNWRT